jgi:Bacterial regulatory proteins, gntR family
VLGASEEPAAEGGGRSAFVPGHMASPSGREEGSVGGARIPRQPGPSRPAIAVLADRIAAALVHHEPGWRLPRHTALARRYNVSTAEIDAAVDNLAARRLVRRLPDGQLYRVSPAEYLIPIEGVPGLGSYADPMGGQIACRSRQASWRQVPPADPVGVIRVQWTAGGEPAAFCTTYLLKEMAGPFIGNEGAPSAAGLPLLPITAPPADPEPGGDDVALVGEPRAVHVEFQPPPPSVARSLRLSAGQPAALVTVRFDDPRAGRPVALTIAVLRPDLFRIVVESGGLALPGGAERSFPGAWTHAVEDWEP